MVGRHIPHSLRRYLLAAAGLCVLSVGAAAAGMAAETTLQARLKPLIEAHKGSVAVAVRHLETGESFGHREAEPMSTASLIKVAVMVEAYRQADAGKIDLDELLTLRDADKVQGSGILTEHFSDGARISLRDAVRLMIAYSDNTATNLVLDRIGLSSTNNTMRELDLPDTGIYAKVFRRDTSIDPDRSRRFGLGSTTADQMVRLLEMIHMGKAASPAACEEMLKHLRACQDKLSLPRELPAGTKIAHKTGSVTNARTAAGIIETQSGPVALCVLTNDNKDRRWSDDNAGNVLCGTVARSVYDHFRARDGTAPGGSPGELSTGASGWLVEALQRTLNRRMEPSPDLSIDGEFGPATQTAVVDFQRREKLPITGVVDEATWKALGPLATSDAAILDPSQLDQSPPEKSPADALAGPPFVTCRAWAIGDAHSGEIFGGANVSESLDFASTTKMMTAWVVLKLAEKDPTVLDETVTVSHRADETPGSTAELRAGEKLPVRELLYGLLLPSGNDAATALAEHFGDRFEPADGSDADDPAARFVAEMNRTAASLGMNDTRYANPHGLTHKEHRSTVRDLFRLACAMSRDERLRSYVTTRRHVGRLEGPGGYARYVLWKNTNRLLDTEGYLGIKTGTTTAAGACLVSLAEREGQRLVAIVLGSTSSDARYTDTRNLFRWAWLEQARRDEQVPSDRPSAVQHPVR